MREKQTAESNYPPNLRVEQAAEYIGVSRMQVFRLLRAGELGSFRVGRRRIIRRADCDEYIERNRVPATH